MNSLAQNERIKLQVFRAVFAAIDTIFEHNYYAECHTAHGDTHRENLPDDTFYRETCRLESLQVSSRRKMHDAILEYVNARVITEDARCQT